METIRNIKVTATYETETKPSKFDALFAQYRVAKAIADETESTKQPLIDAMGERKLELIRQQLDVIVHRLDIISKCTERIAATTVYANYQKEGYKVTIERYHKKDSTKIYLDGYSCEQPWWFKEKGIVTLWNQLGLYEKLEQDCEQMLQAIIDAENRRTARITENYNNMIND